MSGGERTGTAAAESTGTSAVTAVVPARDDATVRALLAALPVAALVFWIYAGVGRELWTTWTTNDNYSHGPLVPAVAALLIVVRRRRLAAIPIRGSWLGLPLLALGCAVEVVGQRSDVFTLQGWSLIIVLTLLGRAWTRALAFPLGFLVFMLTFPPLIVNQLSFALKEVTVRFAQHAAETLGATLLRDGMTIYLAGGELRVENPCSGLRSLLALLATGALFAGLQHGGGWRRLVLFLAAVPVAMAANAIRITALILVGHYVGVPAAGGLVHDVSGYVLYAIALGALLGVRRLLTPRALRRATPSPALPVLAR